MNPNLLPLSLVAAVGLLIAPQTTEATIYAFDVDSSSGIGAGFFTIDLPDLWPGNIGHATLIPASFFRGFYARGDKWTALSVSLNEFVEQVDNAELSGASKKVAAFKIPCSGLGLSPVEAVANLPGVTLLPIGVAQSNVGRQRRSRLFETNILLEADRYRSCQTSRLTSRTFSTDRLVDPASLALEYTCAWQLIRRAFWPQDDLVTEVLPDKLPVTPHASRSDPKGTRNSHNGTLRAMRQRGDQTVTPPSEFGGLGSRAEDLS